MGFFEAVLFGVIQGLTEFLPVSSSGHLVVFQDLMGVEEPGVLFTVSVHLGTTFSILWFFRKRLMSLGRSKIFLIFLGSVPAGLVGFLFSDSLEGLFDSPMVVGSALVITGVMNWAMDGKMISGRGKAISVWDSLVVGVFQAFAIVPGISRSGSTLFAGVSRGVDRRNILEFSLLLSVPAVLASMGLQIFKYGVVGDVNWVNYIVGMLVAAVVGYFAIASLMRFLLARKFRVFAVYCLVLGLTVLAFSV